MEYSFCYMLWHSWKIRNGIVFNNVDEVSRLSKIVVNLSEAYQLALSSVAAKKLLLPSPNKVSPPSHWSPPPLGWLKLNSDGAVRGEDGKAAGGGVFRDDTGNFVIGYGFTCGSTDALGAELWASLYGLRLAASSGFTKVILEVDSTMVSTLLLESTILPQQHMALLFECKQLIAQGGFDLRIKHTPRSCNSVADALAKWAHDANCSFTRTANLESARSHISPFLSLVPTLVRFHPHSLPFIDPHTHIDFALCYRRTKGVISGFQRMKGIKRRPLQALAIWLKRQSPKVKAFLAVVAGMAALVFLRVIVHDHDNLFVAAEAVHAIGICLLIYKLTKEKSCAGLSLKTQELTAIFLAVRLYCSVVMEYDIHTVLDTATLVTTLWVIFMIRFKLRSSYMEDKDNFAMYYVVIPCVVLSLLVHPSTSHNMVNRILWAFCVYLEAVSVLPQLRVMQNTKIVEPFTAHYVFALGVARFLSCAHWVLQMLDTRGHLLTALGYGLWPSMVLLSEIIQTFILADFCYYYVKSVFGGQLTLRLPSGVV